MRWPAQKQVCRDTLRAFKINQLFWAFESALPSIRMLSDHDPRPCHTIGKNPPPCAAAHYRRIIDNHTALHGAWSGWRMAGRDLVSPDGDRINPQRLRGLLFRQAGEARIAKARAVNAQPVVLPARERFSGLA